ncbi:MAG: BamA/TamA family outer membrane protein [bacterium]
MRIRSIVLIAVICILGSTKTKVAEVNLNKIIEDIDYKGLKTITKEQLPGINQLTIKQGKRVISEDLEKDIKKFYLLGYFSEINVQSTIKGAGQKIIFNFKENPVIKDIKITPNKKGPTLKNKIGMPLNINFVKKDKEKIEQWYKDKGVIFFNIEDISFNDHILTFSTRIGKVANIKIEGAKKVNKDILFRELKLKNGDVITQKKLEQARESLRALGYFKYVSVAKLQASGVPNQYVIIFNVQEKKSNRIELGIETDEEEFVGFVQNIYNHAFIESDRIATKIQIGNRDGIPSIKTYNLKYQQPWIANKKDIALSLEAWLNIKQEVLASQRLSTRPTIVQDERQGASIMLSFPFKKKKVIFDTKYKREKISPTSKSNFTSYTLSAFIQRLHFSNIGLNFNPKKGQYWQIAIENGGEIGSLNIGGLKYWRAETEWSKFWPLWGATLAVHVEVSIFESLETIDTLEVEQYVLGGGSTLRGYKDQSYPFVGSRKIQLNVEWRRDINKKWQWVTFVDTGKVMQSGWGFFNQDPYEVGVGLGIRYFTAAGPFRLDVGHSSKENSIHFSLGQLF